MCTYFFKLYQLHLLTVVAVLLLGQKTGWMSGTTNHCTFYSTWHDGKVTLRRRGKGGAGGAVASASGFSKEGDLGAIENWMKKKEGGALLVTEAYDHSNDAVYRGFNKFYDSVMIYESFGSCGNIGPKDRVKHMCSKSSGKQRPSKWRKHKDAYSKLLGTGPYDMIFVKGRGEFLKKLKILSKIVSLY